MTSQDQIEVGYWSVRGIGAPLRMMVMYAGHPLKAVNYDVKEVDGKMHISNKYASDWFSGVKPKLMQGENPLINLPYIRDGDNLVTQSNACLLYLGRKLDMLGSNAKETSECEQLLCEILDLRENMVDWAYLETVTKEGAQDLLTASAGPRGILPKLEQWLHREEQRGGSDEFLVGGRVSAPDFHLWEMLDQYHELAVYFSLPSPFEQLPHLTNFKLQFKSRPENARYFASRLYRLPFNNKYAGFGATLSKDKWTVGMPYDWGDSSGLY